MVVRVVVSERTDGAGDENVLSAPRAELTPPPTVVFPFSDDVAAVDLLPMVGGGRPSSERLIEFRRLSEDKLALPVGTVENDWCPFTG